MPSPSQKHPSTNLYNTGPSLLWAHEIRRENIHLLNRLDTTNASLAASITETGKLSATVSELQHTVGRLQAQVNAHADEKVSKVEFGDQVNGIIEERVRGLTERVEGLEKEKQVLENGLGRLTRMDESLKGVLAGVTGLFEKGVADGGCCCCSEGGMFSSQPPDGLY